MEKVEEREMKKKTVMYQMTSDTATKFYELCKELKAETEAERYKILQAMARLGMMKSVIVTGRPREKIIEDMQKHYKVLDVRENKDGDIE